MIKGASIEIVFGPANLRLLPGCALHWIEAKAIVVADTHFGKAGVFRRHGLALPDGDTPQDLQRLQALIDDTGATRLIVLGDLVHGRVEDGLAAQLAAGFAALADRGVVVDVVTGNHDRNLGDPRRLAPARIHDSLVVQGVHCRHEASPTVAEWTLCGHIHPVWRMRGAGRDSLRMPVFWRSGQRLVLPAFGGFTGGYRVEPDRTDGLWLAGPDAVVAIDHTG